MKLFAGALALLQISLVTGFSSKTHTRLFSESQNYVSDHTKKAITHLMGSRVTPEKMKFIASWADQIIAHISYKTVQEKRCFPKQEFVSDDFGRTTVSDSALLKQRKKPDEDETGASKDDLEVSGKYEYFQKMGNNWGAGLYNQVLRPPSNNYASRDGSDQDTESFADKVRASSVSRSISQSRRTERSSSNSLSSLSSYSNSRSSLNSGLFEPHTRTPSREFVTSTPTLFEEEDKRKPLIEIYPSFSFYDTYVLHYVQAVNEAPRKCSSIDFFKRISVLRARSNKATSSSHPAMHEEGWVNPISHGAKCKPNSAKGLLNHMNLITGAEELYKILVKEFTGSSGGASAKPQARVQHSKPASYAALQGAQIKLEGLEMKVPEGFMLLLHLLQDLHQPVHYGDKVHNNNNYMVKLPLVLATVSSDSSRYFQKMPDGEHAMTSLHGLWDTDIPAYLYKRYKDFSWRTLDDLEKFESVRCLFNPDRKTIGGYTYDELNFVSRGCFRLWAAEVNQINCDVVYEAKENHYVDKEYFLKSITALEPVLKKAVFRTSMVMLALFDPAGYVATFNKLHNSFKKSKAGFQYPDFPSEPTNPDPEEEITHL